MTVVKLLFWNLNGKALWNTVARLARNHEIDVVVPAECAIPSATLSAVLSAVLGPSQRITFG